MRHKYKKILEFNSGVQKTQNVLRTMLTNLVKHGHMTTTSKKAKILKSYADKFFARLVRIQGMYDAAGAKRESDAFVKSVIYNEEVGKKALEEFLPMLLEAGQTGIVRNYKMGYRPGDGAEKVLVKLGE